MGQMLYPDDDQYDNKTHTFKWGRTLIVIIGILLLGGGGYWLSEKYDLFSNSCDTMYVIAEGLNLRSGKGTNSDIIIFADYGERLKVLNRDEIIWAKVIPIGTQVNDVPQYIPIQMANLFVNLGK